MSDGSTGIRLTWQEDVIIVGSIFGGAVTFAVIMIICVCNDGGGPPIKRVSSDRERKKVLRRIQQKRQRELSRSPSGTGVAFSGDAEVTLLGVGPREATEQSNRVIAAKPRTSKTMTNDVGIPMTVRLTSQERRRCGVDNTWMQLCPWAKYSATLSSAVREHTPAGAASSRPPSQSGSEETISCSAGQTSRGSEGELNGDPRTVIDIED